MRIREDGSIQSSVTPTYQNVARTTDHAVYRCMVIKTIFVDDPSNITTNSTNPRVLYDCVVLGGFSAGQIISNCRLMSTLGGNYNFYERTLRASSKDISSTPLTECDGDIVLVQFVQGHTGYPVIVAADQGISTGSSLGAKAADAQILRWQYNGVRTEIDRSGNLTITRVGGSFDQDKGAFVPSSGSKLNVKFETDKMVVTTAAGLVMSIDGTSDSVNITTKGGAKLKIDGSSGEISAQDNGGGKLKIKDSKVGLGTSSNELVDLVKQLADALSVAVYPGFGAPASNVADYAIISSKLASIKGGV